jgi:hypothetical protein
MAWVLVEAKGARLFGSTEPGGQRVEALGGSAVEACGARVGGVGGVVAVGAAKATTEAAPNNSPDKLTYICFMTIHHLLHKSSIACPPKLVPHLRCFRALLHSSIWVAGAMLSSG